MLIFSRKFGVLYKTSKSINIYKAFYFSFTHFYINYANIVWASTNKSRQKQAACIIFNQHRFMHARQ